MSRNLTTKVLNFESLDLLDPMRQWLYFVRSWIIASYNQTMSSEEISLQVFEIVGHVNEHFIFPNYDPEKPIVCDFNDLKMINSAGVSAWVRWSQQFKSSFTLLNVPQVLIEQINMVSGFLPVQAKVNSFFITYYSEDTKQEKKVLYKIGEHYLSGQIPQPRTILDTEGNLMEPDIVEQKFFKFISRYT